MLCDEMCCAGQVCLFGATATTQGGHSVGQAIQRAAQAVFAAEQQQGAVPRAVLPVQHTGSCRQSVLLLLPLAGHLRAVPAASVLAPCGV